MSHGFVLAGTLLFSLTLMGASRKVFGPDVVAQRLVPHRGDIGIAAFLTIGIGACIGLGIVPHSFGPGDAQHWIPAAIAQLGYVSSLIARKDLGVRLLLLILAWLCIASGEANLQVLAETASLWIVKLHLKPSIDPKAKGLTSSFESIEDGFAAAPFLKPKRTSKSPVPKGRAKKNGAGNKLPSKSRKGSKKADQ